MDRDNFYSVAIKNIASASSLHDNDLPKIQFSQLAELLSHIKDTNLSFQITKWLTKQLNTGKSTHFCRLLTRRLCFNEIPRSGFYCEYLCELCGFEGFTIN